MMKRASIFSAAVLLMQAAAAWTASAQPAEAPQGAPSLWNIRGTQYPRVLDDHRVEFRVKAPEAQRVEVELGQRYPMTRDAEGTWTCITEPQSEGFHYYFLVVDGVRVADPASETFYGCSTMASGVEIPYDAAKAGRYALRRDVPHGEVHRCRVYSTVDEAWKTMYVYTPPTYAEGGTFPVLYLQHGGGEDERGWSRQGLADVIMDNLIADGKAVPMVVVMMDGNTRDFTAELTEVGIPYVESHFRVRPGQEGRALAGLSMGGIQTLNAVVARPDLVSHAGVFSSGWFRTTATWMASAYGEPYYETLRRDADTYNRNLRTPLWLSMGGPEDIAYENCQAMMKRLDECGIRYTYYEYPGGHTWPVWRESLWQFAQLIFRPE